MKALKGKGGCRDRLPEFSSHGQPYWRDTWDLDSLFIEANLLWWILVASIIYHCLSRNCQALWNHEILLGTLTKWQGVESPSTLRNWEPDHSGENQCILSRAQLSSCFRVTWLTKFTAIPSWFFFRVLRTVHTTLQTYNLILPAAL